MLRNPSILSKMKIVMQANYKIFLIVEKMEVNTVKPCYTKPNLTKMLTLGLLKINFLDASSHLYKRVCPSICVSISI